MVKFYRVHTNQNTPFVGWGSDSYKWSIHGEFFAVVDHIIFVVNIQVYVLAAIIDFIVVIVLKSLLIFSYSFLFAPRQELV